MLNSIYRYMKTNEYNWTEYQRTYRVRLKAKGYKTANLILPPEVLRKVLDYKLDLMREYREQIKV